MPKVGAEWSSETTTLSPLGRVFIATGGFQVWADAGSAARQRAMARERRVRGILATILGVLVPDVHVPFPAAVFLPPVDDVLHFHLRWRLFRRLDGERGAADFDQTITSRNHVHGREDR